MRRFFFLLILCGMYLLFAGQIDTAEIIAGLPAVALAAVFAAGQSRQARRRYALIAPWPRLLLQAGRALARESWLVGAVLLGTLWRRSAGPRGAITAEVFEPGGDDPVSAGRRALATLERSLAPNGFAVAFRPGAILLHRLAPAPASPNPEWPA